MKEKKTAEQERCRYELAVEKYFGLDPDKVTENTKIDADYGQLVNFAVILSAQFEPEWVPCSERLPESFLNSKSVDVLACAKISTGVKGEFESHILKGYVYYFNWKWFWSDTNRAVENEITHWMPLPTPPTAKK